MAIVQILSALGSDEQQVVYSGACLCAHLDKFWVIPHIFIYIHLFISLFIRTIICKTFIFKVRLKIYMTSRTHYCFNMVGLNVCNKFILLLLSLKIPDFLLFKSLQEVEFLPFYNLVL